MFALRRNSCRAIALVARTQSRNIAVSVLPRLASFPATGVKYANSLTRAVAGRRLFNTEPGQAVRFNIIVFFFKEILKHLTSQEETFVEGRQVFVYDLPREMTTEKLTDAFKVFGNVESIVLRQSEDAPGFAHITFVDSQAATAALQSVLFDGQHRPAVQPSSTDTIRQARTPDTLFVGNLAGEVQADELKNLFSPYGKHTIRRSHRRSAHIQFEDPSEAERAARELKGTEIRGLSVRIDFARPYRQELAQARWTSRPRELSPPSETLWIGNIPTDISVKALMELFGPEGAIECRHNAFKPYAHIQFPDTQTAQNALEKLNGTKLNDATIRFDYAARHSDRVS
ncbi:hypothetical protein PHLCEN_2v10441 [Hermanssonia centrifuga]|uniref:RRM domain-containing protein n=1 Tax=Hermanssonia centrifuga TaxID=98765 RepID=A0A2R6NMW6_9APHY|nr:hypothetical protein PHLCEN_2v10441 [Hermanssonia centrifuga]